MADVSRLTLERWALGDLPPDERAALQASIDADADLRGRAERIQAELAGDLPALPAFTAGDVPESAFRESALEAEVVRGPWGRPALWMSAVAAVLLVGFLLRPEAPPQDRFRGALDVGVHLVRDGVAVEQGLVVEAAAGERLQYRVVAPSAGWVSVFDLQDDGSFTSFKRPTQVRAMQAVEGAVILDDYAGAERIYFVFAEAPVGLDAAKGSLGAAHSTPLVELERLPGLAATQRSVLVVKR